MKLFPSIEKAYARDRQRAADAQRLAQFIAFAPAIFQVSRLMVKWGILGMLVDARDGMTAGEVANRAGISLYAAKILLEASLSAGTVKVNPETERFTASKAGWFLLTDPSARANLDFNHDVNYEGFFRLDDSLREGRPAGLEHFGSWKTIYEGLSSLPKEVQDSWFGFDHFYSDVSFPQALEVVFSLRPRRIMDVGGNTGRWALRCVSHDPGVEVTVVDLPQQIALLKDHVKGKEGAERIKTWPADMLDAASTLPEGFDVIWMSQFLDCFSEEQIVSILRKAAAVMSPHTRLCIMETFWDRQQFETASLCLTLTSVYFTALANGNSKMYLATDFERLVREAGLEVESVSDGLGWGHSIMICKKN